MIKPFKVVVTGGGTAGHITPAISIAKSLEKKYNASIFYLGNENFIEKDLASKASYPFFHINSQGMEGDKPFEKWKNFILRNFKGINQAYRHLKNIGPDFIVSTGGFVTAPVLVAAKMLAIPYFIHEQNTVMGRVNKLFVKDALEVYFSFANTINVKNDRKGKVYGNPVPINEKIDPGNDVVVLGGSGGSEFLNEWAVSFAEKNPKINIHLQAGKKNEEKTKEIVEKKGLKSLNVYGFVDIVAMYKKAKFVITRGGTSSLFELANAEIPSIIVPLPNSMDNHQYMNGLQFQKLGGMTVVEQHSQDEDNELDKVVQEWSSKPEVINEKRKNLSKFSYINCADQIAEDIFDMFGEKTKKLNL
ncbi:UDP-N-acetylglucosamine--N-acetylmuramyl-(pentapeptide) pyrophosphoryl-undecaprenol N-acetylglucosamine transferase [Bacillus mexicanus]|uniref:UDP-N-acetylglucosamine--N-acetylmuramyl- (pentapeptide) pyrophosphoryl-undecaprenol N-acetylglucosamine transferase n=1 Tax=Bacillus mexicanus TaxID=2834415 RepID=UPI003D1AA3A9